jgi:DNA invertase Pin-like site-specific DNA recombinase
MMQPELPWATYIRTSTLDQGEKSSPLKQFLANVAWAKNNGKTIPGIEAAVVDNKVKRGDYIFVDHQTGTNDDRPDLQRFMKLAATGKIGGLVCYVVDRAARNVSDAIKIQKDLKRMRVSFQFAVQNFDNTPAGVAMFQMFAVWAEYEAKLIAEPTHDGRRKRILGIGGKKDGKPRLQGPPLYGYHLVDGIPVEDKDEGPVARFYLRRALEGATSGTIAVELNEAGYRTRKESMWRDTTVSKNLRKALSYAGIYRHRHGIEGAMKAYQEMTKLMGADAPALDLSMVEVIETEAYPPLITREEANLILSKVEKNRIERRGRPPAEFLLVSYLWCEACGCRWYAHRKRYYCGCTQLGRPRCRARAHVAQDRMDAAVIDGMRAYLKQPEVQYALALRDYNASRGDAFHSRDEIDKKLKQLGREQAHYDEQATVFGLTPRQREIARRKSEKLEMEIAQLKAEVRKMSVMPLPSKPGMVAAFGQMLSILDRLKTFAEKREFIEATVERITTDGQRVNVTGAFDVAAIENKGGKGGIYSIGNLGSGLGDQNIGGLQVSVGDALSVRRIERIAKLRSIVEGLIERQRTFESCSLDVLHHEVVRPDIEQRADIGMVQ